MRTVVVRSGIKPRTSRSRVKRFNPLPHFPLNLCLEPLACTTNDNLDPEKAEVIIMHDLAGELSLDVEQRRLLAGRVGQPP